MSIVNEPGTPGKPGRTALFRVVPGDKDAAVEAPEGGHTLAINLTDLGNAKRFARDNADRLRYVSQWGCWLAWDGRRWSRDSRGKAAHDAAEWTLQVMVQEAGTTADPSRRTELLRWALESQSARRIKSMIQLAQHQDSLFIEADQLDRDHWLLNVRSGTIDLRTGQLRPHDPADLITKLADVDYREGAECPRWERFEREIMDDDPEMVEYLRRILGYSLTGDIQEHALFFFWGEGRNGKSLFIRTVQEILGDYAGTIDAGVLTQKHNEDHPTGKAELQGRRFVSTIEVEDGKRMAEALVKQLTGGDRIKARRMRQDPFDFEPTHKLFLAANHKPEIRGHDRAIWDRVKLIPFGVTFADPDDPEFAVPGRKIRPKDRSLSATLREEYPGILASMVRSCLDWQRSGLAEPAKVRDATQSYRAEMNEVSRFIGERCTTLIPDAPKDRNRVQVGRLYEAYREWCRANGREAITSAAFARELEQRGYKAGGSNGVTYRVGLRLLSDLSHDQRAFLEAGSGDEGSAGSG